MPRTKARAEDTVWVTNLATGHTHGMSKETAAYYLNQRDPITGVAQYAEGSEPSADDGYADFDPKEAAKAREYSRHQAASIHTPIEPGQAPDKAVRDSTAPHVPHGVPDAARMEVAAGASESGPTLRAESDRRAVIGGEAPVARQGEAQMAATEGQAVAEDAARKEAADRSKSGSGKGKGKSSGKKADAPSTPSDA